MIISPLYSRATEDPGLCSAFTPTLVFIVLLAGKGEYCPTLAVANVAVSTHPHNLDVETTNTVQVHSVTFALKQSSWFKEL